MCTLFVRSGTIENVYYCAAPRGAVEQIEPRIKREPVTRHLWKITEGKLCLFIHPHCREAVLSQVNGSKNTAGKRSPLDRFLTRANGVTKRTLELWKRCWGSIIRIERTWTKSRDHGVIEARGGISAVASEGKREEGFTQIPITFPSAPTKKVRQTWILADQHESRVTDYFSAPHVKDACLGGTREAPRINLGVGQIRRHASSRTGSARSGTPRPPRGAMTGAEARRGWVAVPRTPTPSDAVRIPSKGREVW
ncbi:hypothetical protein DFH09DRAFT_1110003 [Mycena vulgaris]|nr:hypothetical protein DFH09DRAFT_1110003 [Mycena vulgaris]